MKAILLKDKEEISIQEVPKPVPAEDEVRVRVEAAGLCGSEFHNYHDTYPATSPENKTPS